ncbi:MAG TPA: SOS response-associated peptidase [Terriglobia bacterium]|nr:SOS response-associated peptidase [Terriglobia bacterium]
MCGRYRLSAVERIEERLGLDDPDVELHPRYNIAPSQQVPIVRQFGGVRTLSIFRWGLVPFWAKGLSIGYKTINARSETVMQKPAFKQSFAARRCLIPAHGFFEWVKDGAKKRPFDICMKDGSVRLRWLMGLLEEARYCARGILYHSHYRAKQPDGRSP